MDGMAVTVPVGVVDLDDQSRPWVTSVAQVRQVVPKHDPEAALVEAEKLLAERLHVSDKLRGLHEQRRITTAEMCAAGEIGLMVEWIEGLGGVVPVARQQFRERMASSTTDAAETSWLWKLELEHTRYQPWREWAQAYPVSAEGSMETLTRLFVVAELGVRQVADTLRVDQRRAERLLRRSLHRYAVLAGRQAGDSPPELPA